MKRPEDAPNVIHQRIEYLLDAVKTDIGLAAMEDDVCEAIDGLMLAAGCLEAVRQDVYALTSLLARENGPESAAEPAEGQGQGCTCDRCEGGQDDV